MLISSNELKWSEVVFIVPAGTYMPAKLNRSFIMIRLLSIGRTEQRLAGDAELSW